MIKHSETHSFLKKADVICVNARKSTEIIAHLRKKPSITSAKRKKIFPKNIMPT